ncbi:MAG: hypothetical protein GX640_21690 [Fibrobacter sp.]|nr:hypothetical protein [Fibrobacter sp.]
MRKLFLWINIVLCISAVSVFAQLDDLEETGSDVSPLKRLNLSASGNGYIMFGQLVSGHENGTKDGGLIDHRWQNFYSARLELTTQPVEWFYTTIGLEVSSDFPIIEPSVIQKEIYRPKVKANIPKAVGVFDLKFSVWSLFIEAGLMEYNFAPEIKNLGNYLYRAVAYPFWMDNKIDYTYANLMGTRIEAKFIDEQLKIGTIINSEIKRFPFYDFSLGFTASFTTANKFLDVGAGFVFDRLFSVNKKLTDCETSRNNFTDTTLTFRAKKLDTRLTLDPKQLFGNPSFMGKEDLKIYGEAGIIGLKDPQYYIEDPLMSPDLKIEPSLFNRMPLLVGFNIPTFKVLDLLSVELEYCNYPYSFNWWGSTAEPSPQPNNIEPITADDTLWRLNYKYEDNVRWTIYIKKSFSKFDIKLMFAKDHYLYYTPSLEAQPNYEQSLRTPKDWHWYLKLQYNL